MRFLAMRLVIDGMNVIGSRPDGWWRDRDGAMRRLVAALRAYADETGEQVAVVLDARPFDVGKAGAVAVHFAPGGRNAGDDEIVRILERDESPETVRVVTSDRDLAARAEALGAEVVHAGGFRRMLDRVE
jgi:predicted RNA-binding protein with PIN domain